MNRVKQIAVLVVLTAVLGLPTACTIGTTVSKNEEPSIVQMSVSAPDFQLQDLAGKTVFLSELRGKPVVINFWASWCGPCREEMPYIQQVHEKWANKGLVILAINIQENPAVASKFMADYKLTFTALLDTKGEVAATYKVRGIPATFFIDKDGIIRGQRVGAFSSVKQIEDSLARIMP
ncbi:MAG: TlpA family protein disulfide reductase [Chloroflexi bacterium]|nr:TlpA family protein disulfide reductase [Chloroflexota bacterium]